MTFLLYPKMPEDELRKVAADSIVQITDWFDKNPDRNDCRAEFWYGKLLSVKRETIAEQVNGLLEETLKKDRSS